MLSGSEVVEILLFNDETVDESGQAGRFPGLSIHNARSRGVDSRAQGKSRWRLGRGTRLVGGSIDQFEPLFSLVVWSAEGGLQGVRKINKKVGIIFFRRALGIKCEYHSTAFFKLYRMICVPSVYDQKIYFRFLSSNIAPDPHIRHNKIKNKFLRESGKEF